MNYDDLAPDLLVTSRGNVRVVTMNRPEEANSITDGLHEALYSVWQRLLSDDGADAVVLTGAGKAFSAGGSMDLIEELHRDLNARRRSVRGAERLLREMISCEIPIVAAINGPAVGLGATLALLCDLSVMSSDTFICDPHVNVGVVAGDGGAVLWPLMMSMAKAKELLLLGDRVPANDAIALGLVNRVVEPGDVLPAALALADRLAHQPRQAVRDTKRALNLHVRQAADLVLDFSLAAEYESFGHDDVMATVRAHRAADTT